MGSQCLAGGYPCSPRMPSGFRNLILAQDGRFQSGLDLEQSGTKIRRAIRGSVIEVLRS